MSQSTTTLAAILSGNPELAALNAGLIAAPVRTAIGTSSHGRNLPPVGDGWVYVPVEPKGKPRARVTKNGAYQKDGYKTWQNDFVTAFLAAGGTVPDGYVSVDVIAVRGIPTSRRSKNSSRLPGEWCDTTPDVDNIVGSVMDALLKNDSRVVKASCEKIWGDDYGLWVRVVAVE